MSLGQAQGPPVARRLAEAGLERPREMRGVLETHAEGDLRHRLRLVTPIHQIDRGLLEPAVPYPAGDRDAQSAAQYLIQTPAADPLDLRDPIGGEVAIAEVQLDEA